MLNNGQLARYRWWRQRHGMRARTALQVVKAPTVDYEYIGPDELRIKTDAHPEWADFEIHVKAEPDSDPLMPGRFTDEWSRDAIINKDWRRRRPYVYHYFVPEIGVREHRKGLSELGYSRGVAQQMAERYVREDMERALDPWAYIIIVTASRDDMELGRADVGSVDVDPTRDIHEQFADYALGEGLIDEAVAEARRTDDRVVQSSLDRLFVAAGDGEAEVIEEVARRAGLIWRCECGWNNGESDDRCGSCTRPRRNGDVD